MSRALSYTSSYSFTSTSCTLLVILLLLLGLSSCQSCNGLGTFGFDIHHRFSDTVKAILGADGLPEKGSIEYHATMARRDRVIQGRHLAASNNQSPLTFANGNNTLSDPGLLFLYYANVSVGTPSLSFLVALDTGSDLFWLPCDCQKDIAVGCSTHTNLLSSGKVSLNIYNPNASSTSENVPSDSTLCQHCQSGSTNCDYCIEYGSSTVSSSSAGIWVKDVLHLITDDDKSKVVVSKIPFGCGRDLNSSYPVNLPPNGLLGLSFTESSVPSILASNGLVSNSFSMCFGADDHGRITFGDTGSSDQKEEPFTVDPLNPSYNITVSQITVRSNVSKLDFSAIFDSGTTHTYLKDPAYTNISMSFDSQVKEYRFRFVDRSTHFEYCYNTSKCNFPEISLTLKGGNEYVVTNPVVQVNNQSIYCLAIIKIGDSDDNIIGKNFMTGYHIVFNREKKVIGWKASDCGYSPSQCPPTPDGNWNSPPESPPAPNRNSNSPPPESPLAPNHNSNPPPEYPPAQSPLVGLST